VKFGYPRPMSPTPTSLARLAGIAAIALACGGVAQVPPAEARPRAAPAAKKPAPRRAVAIDARTVDRIALRWESAVGGFGKAVAVHGGLGRVFVVTDREAAVHGAATGERLAALPACKDVLRGGLSVSGTDLLIACEGTLVRLGASSLARGAAPKIAPAPATAVAFAPGRVALGHRDGVIRIYDLDGGATREIAVPGPPVDVKSLAMTPDASLVAVAWVQGSVWWWRTNDPGTPHDLVRHASESDALAFGATGPLLAEEGDREHTTVWRLGDGAERAARIRNGDWVKRIHFLAQDRWLARGGSDGLELAELAGPRRVALDTSAAVEDVALDERATGMAAVDRKGRLTYWAVR
jgi:hypothetical protein